MEKIDLIYVIDGDSKTMSCAVEGLGYLIGPYPANEAGPAIVSALMVLPELGLEDKGKAENAYTLAHFRNMARGENLAGQAYPFRIMPPNL